MSFLVRTPKPPVANQAPAYGAMRVQSSCYGGVITAGFGTTRLTGNMIWSGDFQSHAHSSGGGGGGGGGGKGGGGGGGGGGGSTTYTYSTSLAMALAQGPVKGVGVIWKGKETQALGPLGGSLFEGTPGQAPWGYLASKHPDQTLGYSDTAYVGFADFDLGESNSMPNLSFETMMLGPPATRRQSAASGFIVPGLSFDLGNGVFDADMTAAVEALVDEILADLAAGTTPVWDTHFAWAIKHLLTAPFGPQFPAAHVGDFSVYATYCHAHGFAMSTALQEARPANEMLDEWVRSTVAEFVWSDGLLKIVPYGMEQVASNGVVYVPDPTPVYDLGPDDFIINQGEGGGEGDDIGGGAVPVTVRRKNLADTYNRVKVEFLDRANSYNVAVAVAEDPAHIATFGLREAPVMKCHWFAEADVAQLAAELALYRHLNVTTEFEFPLGWRHVLLEPMDLVTLTEPETGLELELVCVTEIEEDDEGRLMAKAENVPDGVSIPPARVAFQIGASFSLDLNADPGDVSSVVVFEPPVELTELGLEMWVAACGGPDWAGCEVWVSADDTSYRRAGVITAPARMGALAAPLPAGGDPDAVNTLSVDLSASRAHLLNGTQAEADALDTLCWVNGEMLAYRDAVLTGENGYDLSYLRRGAYGTVVRDHAAQVGFVRVDNAVFKFPFTKDQIGRTIWIKLASFNAFGGGLQDLAEVEPFTYTIVGPKAPPAPTNLFRRADKAVWEYPFSWPTFAGFKVRTIAGRTRNWEQGRDWPSDGAVITATELDLTGLGTGEFMVMIRAVDVRGQLSDGTLYMSVGLGEPSPANVVVMHDFKAAGFPGTVTNGMLVGGDLAAIDQGDLYLPDGAAIYLPAIAEPYLPLSYRQMVYEFQYLPAITDVPAELRLLVTVEGEGWQILYRRRGSALYLDTAEEAYLADGAAPYLAGSDPWSPWPGSIQVGRETIEFRVIVEAGTRRGRVAACRAIVDVPDVEESFDDLVLDPAGTRVPLTKAYRVIDYLGEVTVQDDGNGAVSVRWVDKNPQLDAQLGPLLQAVDSNNIPVQATVDIHKLKGH